MWTGLLAAAAIRGRAASREEAEFCIGDDRYIGDPRYRFPAL
jgi:hypothetical protein